MKTKFCPGLAVIVAAACLIPAPTRAYTTNVHTSFHWHMHQPIYWPNHRDYGVDHYEQAWDSIQQQNRPPDPSPEVLSSVFGEADRINAYQTSPYDVLSSILSYPNSGAQMSFSGALIENVQSLATAGQLGYGTDWDQDNQILRSWTTSGGHPRLDLVNFTYHHALAPLVSAATLQMELLIQQRQMQIFWGASPPQSRGYFPAETCFAEYMIPTLQSNGIAWSIVANNHLARACADFPVVTGSGGENCDLPNLADQLDPAQGAANYQRLSIQRGCAPTQVMPFGFQVHYARYVNPQTGAASTLMVVPSDQAFSWMDSYGTWNLDLLAPLQARNNPAKPALALFAHDGDNAWSGGYTYHNQWVNELAGQAGSLGYEPTTIEQFLQDFPPATNDIVHVESGGWVFADGDFGSPIFINWHWPPSYTAANGANVVDPSLGVSDKADNWRVITATENRVRTAQQISGITPNIDQVRDPGSYSGTPNAVELGWHYYLASLDSGFVYFGCTGDECERSSVAQSNAVRNVDPILSANPSADTTPPTIFIPQRHPWNPGGTNFGVQYGYTLTVETNTDFWIWTYAYDVSGITNAALLFRIDGTNPPVSDEFKTYAGGPGTGPWITSNLTLRVVAPTLGVTPQYIADYYYTKVTGITNAYVDYYVSATDRRGNTSQSPIQHVWVGAGSGGSGGGNGSGCDGVVCVTPAAPVAGSQVTIQYNPAGGPIASATSVDIHLGWNGWNPSRLAGRGHDLSDRIQPLAIHRDHSEYRDAVELLFQQRQRHLGQQQRGELEFQRHGEHQSRSAVPTAEPYRHPGADQSNQSGLVGCGGRDGLHRQSQRFADRPDQWHKLFGHGPDGEHGLLLLDHGLQQCGILDPERDSLHEHACRHHPGIRAGRRFRLPRLPAGFKLDDGALRGHARDGSLRCHGVARRQWAE